MDTVIFACVSMAARGLASTRPRGTTLGPLDEVDEVDEMDEVRGVRG